MSGIEREEDPCSVQSRTRSEVRPTQKAYHGRWSWGCHTLLWGGPGTDSMEVEPGNGVKSHGRVKWSPAGTMMSRPPILLNP